MDICFESPLHIPTTEPELNMWKQCVGDAIKKIHFPYCTMADKIQVEVPVTANLQNMCEILTEMIGTDVRVQNTTDDLTLMVYPYPFVELRSDGCNMKELMRGIEATTDYRVHPSSCFKTPALQLKHEDSVPGATEVINNGGGCKVRAEESSRLLGFNMGVIIGEEILD